MLFDSNNVIKRCVEHVTELYHDERGDPPDVSNQNGCTIMKSDTEHVIKEMKCGKASGNDDVATDVIKALEDEGIKKIADISNHVYDTGYLPPDMSSSICVIYLLLYETYANEYSPFRLQELTKISPGDRNSTPIIA